MIPSVLSLDRVLEKNFKTLCEFAIGKPDFGFMLLKYKYVLIFLCKTSRLLDLRDDNVIILLQLQQYYIKNATTFSQNSRC